MSLASVRETSAMFNGGLPWVPEKMMSSLDLPRSCLRLCSPITQRMASTTLLLPQPFGPTTAEMPGGNSSVDLSQNDLNPDISSFLSFISHAFVGAFFIHFFYCEPSDLIEKS